MSTIQTVSQPSTLTVAQIADMSAEDIIKHYGNKSNAIRALHGLGLKRSQIAKTLGIIYQHVRNVLITPLKRDGQL